MKFQGVVADAIVVILFISAGIVFVLFPELTTRIANKLGVGRGTDLIVYVCIIFFLFVIIRLYARLRRLEQMITRIVRDNTLRSAKGDLGQKDQ
jgi:hypothetical protein